MTGPESGPPAWHSETGEITALAVQPSQPAHVANVVAGPGETAASAVAAMAKAQVEARYLMALQRPRSMATVRVTLLKACARPRMAETARYAKPIGMEKVRGWTIRFAEEAARCLGNLLIDASVTFDDASVRIVRVMVTDLESNLSWPQDVTVIKTVERRSPDGRTVISQRRNSRGMTTYTIPATDDEVTTKQSALVSKAARTGILRLLPGDILEEALEVVEETNATEDKRDPAARAKKVADGFFALGVMPVQIERVIGKTLDLCTAADVTLMRTWANALQEGDASWSDIEATFGQTGGADAETKSKGQTALLERLAKPKAKDNPNPTDDAEKDKAK